VKYSNNSKTKKLEKFGNEMETKSQMELHFGQIQCESWAGAGDFPSLNSRGKTRVFPVRESPAEFCSILLQNLSCRKYSAEFCGFLCRIFL
jgi:hypothetical protein